VSTSSGALHPDRRAISWVSQPARSIGDRRSRETSPTSCYVPSCLTRLIGNSAFDLESICTSPPPGLESQGAGFARSMIRDYKITVMINDRGSHDEVRDVCRDLLPPIRLSIASYHRCRSRLTNNARQHDRLGTLDQHRDTANRPLPILWESQAQRERHLLVESRNFFLGTCFGRLPHRSTSTWELRSNRQKRAVCQLSSFLQWRPTG